MTKRIYPLLLAIILSGFFASACKDRTPGTAAGESPAVSELKPMPLSPARKALGDLGRSSEDGSGKVEFLTALRTGSPGFQAYGAFIKEQKIFRDLADIVTEMVPLKEDLIVLFKPCGEMTAYYSPADDNITISGELVDFLNQSYAGPEEGRVDAIRGAVFFTFLHELGHALIQRLDFPFTGREEDVADQFAFMLLLQYGDDGQKAVLYGAQFFYDLAQTRSGETPILWDEHPLEMQRFYNIACWIYGSDPSRFAGLVSNGILPAERAVRAEDEFQKLHRNWQRLLNPYLRRPLA